MENLFDDLEDLPQPKTVDAELPKPKLDAELPGVRQEPQEPETVEPVDVAEEQAGLQAPEFTVPTPEPAPPTPSPLPASPAAVETKGSGPLYLVVGGLIVLGMVGVGVL